MPFPLPQPSQIHGPIAPQRWQHHLGRRRGPGLDGTGLVAITGDQVVAAVDLGVGLERDSQSTDLPDQFRSCWPIGCVKKNVDCSPDGRAALLDETIQATCEVGIRCRDEQSEMNDSR